MVGKLAVAWATPVDASTLGAQLEAYAETKVTILSLRLCIRHAQTGSALGRLPIELVENVATLIQQSIFEDHKGDWDQSVSCCLSDCAPIDHMDPEDYEDKFGEYLGNHEEFQAHGGSAGGEVGNGRSDFEASMRDEDEVVGAHDEIVDKLLTKIGYYPEPEVATEFETKFAKCRKVFAEEFRLETYFSVFQRYDEADKDNRYNPTSTIFGYLILPSRYSFLKIAFGPVSVSFSSAMILDPLLLKEPSPEERSRFKRAMIQLRLAPKVPPEQVTDTYPTSDAHLLRTGQRIWKDLENEEYEVQAASLEHTEWPKLMVLASVEEDD